jgi:hypothetical protein
LSTKGLGTKGFFLQIVPFIISAVVITSIISIFYTAGWFSLSSPIVQSSSSNCRPVICISDAISACTSEGTGLVKVRGEIVKHTDECCDFYLCDDTGEILVQSDVILPCKEGRCVIVYGRIVKMGFQYVITDSRIEFH